MKWGEKLLLWVAGLWTLLLSLYLLLVSLNVTSGDLIWLFVASLPVWIICGLIWVTFYGSSRRSPIHNRSAVDSSVQHQRGSWATAKDTLLNIIAAPVLVIFMGVITLLVIGGFIGIAYWSLPLVRQWVNVQPGAEEWFRESHLFDEQWKIKGWKIFMWAGLWVLFYGFWVEMRGWWRVTTGILDFYQSHPDSSLWKDERLSKKISVRVLGWFLRGKYRCNYCSQRHETDEAAKECCVTSPPTRAWIRSHKPLTKQDIWKSAMLYGLPGYAVLIIVLGGVIFIGDTPFSWGSWLVGMPFLYGVCVYTTYRYDYNPLYKGQKLCEGCGVRADSSYGGKWLCTRCDAKLDQAELEEEKTLNEAERYVPEHKQQREMPSFHQGEYILTVDDNPDVISIIKGILEEKGYKVISANSGHEALEILQSNKPSLILTNVMMPGIDGFELLIQLKKQPQTAAIPVVVVTTRQTIEDEAGAYRLGAVGYLRKPFTSTDLLNCVSSIIGSPKI